MRLLDTHEQKSPRFLVEAFPDIQITTLTVGDYLSAEKKKTKWCFSTELGMEQEYLLHGNLVEIKIGTDFGIHTEQLERFQDELYRMRLWQKKNPKVDLHAVWLCNHFETILPPFAETRVFMNLCFKYHVWGHIFTFQKDLIDFLKELDRPSGYIRDECFIKRDHTTITKRAKRIRVEPRISSEKAVELDRRLTEAGYVSPASMFCISIVVKGADSTYKGVRLLKDVKEIIYDVLGRKKDGTPTKLSLDFITYLEEGE